LTGKPASAAIVTLQFSGEVSTSSPPARTTDQLGFFGPAGTNLAGVAVTETFTFDDTATNSVSRIYVRPHGGVVDLTQLYNYGFSSGGTQDAQITIGGHTIDLFDIVSFTGAGGGVVRYPDLAAATVGTLGTYDGYHGDFDWGGSVTSPSRLNVDYHSGLQLSGLSGSQDFEFDGFIPGQGELLDLSFSEVHSSSVGQAAPFQYIVDGVPEPGVWIMLLLGVSGLGASLRDIRRQGLATTG
jgi:hypothetical protein